LEPAPGGCSLIAAARATARVSTNPDRSSAQRSSEMAAENSPLARPQYCLRPSVSPQRSHSALQSLRGHSERPTEIPSWPQVSCARRLRKDRKTLHGNRPRSQGAGSARTTRSVFRALSASLAKDSQPRQMAARPHPFPISATMPVSIPAGIPRASLGPVSRPDRKATFPRSSLGVERVASTHRTGARRLCAAPRRRHRDTTNVVQLHPSQLASSTALRALTPSQFSSLVIS